VTERGASICEIQELARIARFRRHLFLLLGTIFASALFFIAAASSASAFYLGVQWTGGYDQTSASAEMEAVGKSGAQLFRMAVNPEHSGNGSDWNYYDSVFGHAAENGVTILPQIGGRLNGATGLPSAEEKEGWKNWLQKAVQKYGYNGSYWSSHPGIPARPAVVWELGNEPNNESFGAISAVTYGEFLAWAGPAIQSASEAQSGQKTGVLFGGLLAWSGGTGYQAYLKTAWEVPGVKTAFTGLSFHPYELDTSKFPGKSRMQALKEAVKGARTYLNGLSGGGSGKSIWITEFGWPVGGSYAVSEAEQATLLTESFNWLKTEATALNLQSILWYNYRDIGVESWQYRSGLRDQNGGFRRSWWAFLEQTGVQFWPVAANWYSDNLAGASTSSPDISSWGPNRLDVFTRGANNALYHRTWDGSGWAAWEYLGGALNSGPGAVAWGPNRIDVTALAANNSMAHWWNQGEPTWYTDNLGGTFSSDPDISSWGSNRLDIFARGTEHSLWHRFWNGLAWSVWEYLGGDLNSGPGAVSWGNNRIDVVALAANNSVAHWWWVGTEWHTDNLGGNLLSDPDIASPEPGRLDVVGRGVENALWHKRFIQGQGWTEWERVGGPVYSGVGAVSKEKGRIDVVGMGRTNTVTHSYWQSP